MNYLKKCLAVTALLLTIMSQLELQACTSFMLENKGNLYFVHSLNQGNAPTVPGMVCINQRDTWKTGYSWEKLIEFADTTGPDLVWKSRYGSVTFNPFGKELPDGGMNEAGLYIWEMGFDTEYPSDQSRPTLFQCQWMQYVLDNLTTVSEVIENAHEMSIDGWGWHYFIADKSGRTAIIDFIDGKPVVHTGEEMPVPLCCNSYYPDAIRWLNQHKGFGGELEIEKIHEEIPRFIYGAKLMQEFDTQDPVEYSFWVLDEMSNNVRWSIVFDVANSEVHYNTHDNHDIRKFKFTSEDFGRSDGPLILDIYDPGPGDVKDKLVPYNQAQNIELLTEVFGMIVDMDANFRKVLLDDQGIGLAGLVSAINGKVGTVHNNTGFDMSGEWTGTVKYPASDEYMELPVTMTLASENGIYTGTIDDGQLITNLPMTNITCKGGLLYFTVHHPVSGDILQFQLHNTGKEIKGPLEIRGKVKQGDIRLSRQS